MKGLDSSPLYGKLENVDCDRSLSHSNKNEYRQKEEIFEVIDQPFMCRFLPFISHAKVHKMGVCVLIYERHIFMFIMGITKDTTHTLPDFMSCS